MDLRMVDASSPPAGFLPLTSSCAFVTLAGTFFIRSREGAPTAVGAWIGREQANSEGLADRGFLLTFADFALTEVTDAITVRISAEFAATARIGDWIQATVAVRGTEGSLLFADAVVAGAGGAELMRVHGTFLPVKKRSSPSGA